MSVATAFSTKHPDVLAWHHESVNIREEWQTRVAEFMQGFPDHTALWSYFGLLDGHVAGLKGSEAPGEGWRHNKRSVWVPDKRTAQGKALAAQIESLRYRLPQIPGMPDMADYKGRWHHPGIWRDGDVVWSWWSCPVEPVRAGGWSRTDLDETVWTVQPLSAYYLAKEADEARERV